MSIKVNLVLSVSMLNCPSNLILLKRSFELWKFLPHTKQMRHFLHCSAKKKNSNYQSHLIPSFFNP